MLSIGPRDTEVAGVVMRCGRLRTWTTASVLAAALVLVVSVSGDSLKIALPPPVGVQESSKGLAPASELVRQRLDRITMPGFSSCCGSGNPALPCRTIYIALPPDADESSVRVEQDSLFSANLPGTRDLAPAPGIAPVGETTPRIGTARNASVYGVDAFYPREQVRLTAVGRMRACKIAALEYWPYAYNPVSGKLRKMESTAVALSFSRVSKSPAGPRDGATQVPEFVSNRAEAAAWYAQEEPSGQEPVLPGYAIITTTAIAVSSANLPRFTDMQALRGFSVTIATEQQWGGGTGDVAAENIRHWLQAHYIDLGINYVLLIGSPEPETGDVPMKMLWPYWNYSSYRDAPSDYYYADLTGNWDLDGDGISGEQTEDFGPGGVDRFPEVYVGRIPYYGSIEDLDHILGKTIDYESASLGDWSRRVIVAAKPLDPTTLSYQLGEAITSNVALPAGFSVCRLYDSDYGLDPPPERWPCTYDAVREEWTKGAGFVCWMTHGANTLASEVITSARCRDLDDSKPAFVYQASCSNGQPDDPENLGYALLRQGAIGTLSASTASWYYIGETDFTHSDSAGGLAYQYALFLVKEGESCGQAALDARLSVPMNIWPNQLVFNIYGDPSAGLNQTICGGLAGAVLTLGEAPIPGALVRSADGTVWTRTRGDGSYLLRGLGQGARDILVSSPGFYPQRFYGVPVQPGAVTHLEVRLAEAANGTVTGHVYDVYGAPVQDAVVAVGDSGFEARTPPDGSFEIGGLPPGSYTVKASKFPFAQETVSDYAVGEGSSTELDIVLRSRTGNAIANGGFEDGFEDGLGLNWSPYSTRGYAWTPEMSSRVWRYRACSQRLRLPPCDSDAAAGIYQTASVLPGKNYTIVAWQRDSFDGKESDPARNIVCRLGYDATGATDPFAPTVVWQEFDAAHDVWHSMFKDVVPYAAGLTVFLEAKRKNSGDGENCSAWFDGIALMGPIAAPSIPTVAVLAPYQIEGASIAASWHSADSDVAGYEWAVSATADESGMVSGGGWLAAGASNSGSRSGLALANGDVVRVLARAKTNTGVASDIGVSEPVRIVADARRIAATKALPDGTWVLVRDACVTRVGQGPECWVQEFDRTAAIKIEGDWAHVPHVQPGTRASVIGRLITRGSTKVLQDAQVMPSIAQAGPGPLGMRGSSAIGSAPDTSGLLVMIVGRVTDTAPDRFTIDDGSIRGGLTVHLAGNVTGPEAGRLVRAVGIAGPEGLTVLDQTDIMGLD